MFAGSTPVGLIVTLSLLFLFLLIVLPTCIGIAIYLSRNRRNPHSLQTRVITNTPATGATVVTSNQTTSTTNPILYTQPQYPQYPQQPVYKDALLSSQELPPSYDAVTAANPTQQIPVVICLLIIGCIQWAKCSLKNLQ